MSSAVRLPLGAGIPGSGGHFAARREEPAAGAAAEALPMPMHLSLAGRRVVVVGGGAVADRKVRSCLASAAEVTVISPELGPGLMRRFAEGQVSWCRRPYAHGDLDGSWLVFATTPHHEVNAAVEAEAETLRVFCVRADSHREGSARTPAILRQGGVVVGVSSVGPANPGHVAAVRDAIAQAVVLLGQAEPRTAVRDIGGP